MPSLSQAAETEQPCTDVAAASQSFARGRSDCCLSDDAHDCKSFSHQSVCHVWASRPAKHQAHQAANLAIEVEGIGRGGASQEGACQVACPAGEAACRVGSRQGSRQEEACQVASATDIHHNTMSVSQAL